MKPLFGGIPNTTKVLPTKAYQSTCNFGYHQLYYFSDDNEKQTVTVGGSKLIDTGGGFLIEESELNKKLSQPVSKI